MSALEQWLLHSVGSPLVFALVAADLALAALLVFLPTQVLLVALSTLLLARGSGAIALALLLAAAVTGAWLGDAAVFVAARRVDIGRHPWFSTGRIGAVRAAFQGRFTADPTGVLIAARFLPLGRIATVLLAAESSLTPGRYLRTSLLAASVWASGSIAVGAIAGAWARREPLLVTVIAVVTSSMLASAVHLLERRARVPHGPQGPS